MTPTVERIAENQEREIAPWAPRISARGHLALVDWNKPADAKTAENIVLLPRLPRTAAPARSRAETLIERGIAVWMITVVLAVAACMTQL